MQEVYKDWTINVENKTYKIIGFESDGKPHVLYSAVGTSGKKKVRDHFGNQLYDAYESNEQALEKAKAYIDMYSDRLVKYLKNRIESRAARKLSKLNS